MRRPRPSLTQHTAGLHRNNCAARLVRYIPFGIVCRIALRWKIVFIILKYVIMPFCRNSNQPNVWLNVEKKTSQFMECKYVSICVNLWNLWKIK